VIRTRVGYAGGTKKNPTYHDLGDHTETVQVDFDPQVISFLDLLDVFWSSHEATQRSWSRQYMSAVFYHDAEQARQAREQKERREEQAGRKLQTEILGAAEFYLAEDYHQKYMLQGDHSLMREFRSMYPGFTDFLDSTAAARVNGYLYGCRSLADLRMELGSLGLSPEGNARLLERVARLHT
jgi:peptide-methionine (S)-S-oxide reductase